LERLLRGRRWIKRKAGRFNFVRYRLSPCFKELFAPNYPAKTPHITMISTVALSPAACLP
jgi:hypothetical protein